MDEAWSRRYPDLAAKHFWWRVRRQIVLHWVERIAAGSRLDILDIGCGSGDTLRELLGNHNALGVEPDADVILVEPRLKPLVTKMPVEEFEPSTVLDLVLMLDVLEHIAEPEAVLEKVRGWTRPGGSLIVTVPAYMWLWSSHDVANHHYRRYTRAELIQALNSAGFLVERAEYLFPILVVPKLIVRWLERWRGNVESARMPGKILNGSMVRYLSVEARIGRRLDRGWPTGTSVMAVARVGATHSPSP